MGIILRYIILALLFYYIYKKVMAFLEANSSQNTQTKNNSSQPSQDPYEILGVDKNANADEVHKAYLQKISEYHPDKVDHLGEEIKVVARQKTQKINWAYNQLKNK